MASSSSSMRQKREVFLSFRGEDTRYNFTSHLHKALSEKAIDTFIDNNLERGDEISLALLKTIEESMISIVILSKNYASSSWCLDELSKIIECRKSNGQIVVPIFYHVDPSDVRKQTGSFAKAFAEHKERFKDMTDKVERWRAALTEVGSLSGYHVQNDRPETVLLHDIIEDIREKLYRTSSGDFNENHSFSSDFKGLVGIDSRIEQIKSLLHMELESACFVLGIWGMGGIGKTTIARAIFKQISRQFPYCYFLENVREKSEKHGVDSLRKELLGQILKDENIKRGTVDLKSTFISKRLGRIKVLIVLDDVNDLKQLESIGLDQFGKGSKIIITTRNLEVLKDGIHEVYKVEELNYREALRLFCLKAFKQNDPIKDFMGLSNEVVRYAAGVPLALKVLGRFLFGRSKDEWKSALDKLKKTPNRDIQNVLRISYEGLDLLEKNIFCDIACFFKGEDKDRVSEILDGCGLCAEIGIRVLIEKSLITIGSYNGLRMHDLLLEMGWEIVREESEEPGERSRLWNHEDVCHVLTEETGTKAVKGIFLDLSKISEVRLSSKAFKKMCNLRMLKIYYFPLFEGFERSNKLHFPQGLEFLSNNLRYFHWEGYPLESLPLNFHPENLVELYLPSSKVQYLWEGTQPLFKLRKIDLYDCKDLIKIPDLSKAPNLEIMYLYGCEGLLEVHSSIQYLSKLKVLKLGGCKKLMSLPSIINLKSLRELDCNGCSNLKEFLEISGKIEELDLSRIPMEDFPTLDYLFTISAQCLWRLYLNNCNLLKIPDSLGNLSTLRSLSLRGNNFASIPASIRHLSQLSYIDLCDCKRLQSLPELPSCLRCISAQNCVSLETISISSIRVTGAEQSFHMMFRYDNCLKLDYKSRSKVGAGAQLNIQLLATALAKQKDIIPARPFEFACPGSEIPKWFSYRCRGSLVTAQLPQHWANDKFLGFALCAVVGLEDGLPYGNCHIVFRMKTYNGEYDILSDYNYYTRFKSEHVIIWYANSLMISKFKKDDWFRNYCYNEASFQFGVYSHRVEKCGVHLLYAQDEDGCNSSMIQSTSPNENFGVVDQGLLEPMAEEGSHDHNFYSDGTEEEPHSKRMKF